MKSERQGCAVAFLKAAIAYYASLGITVERVMTDNGSCYKSFAFRKACKRLGLKHIRTKPYTPKPNGKAERFIQTSLREWAYARAYNTSKERAAELPRWLHTYNWRRPHGSIGSMPPISRLALTSPQLVVDTSLFGTRAAWELVGLDRAPKMVVSDNGGELTSNAILRWADQRGPGTTLRRASPCRMPSSRASTFRCGTNC